MDASIVEYDNVRQCAYLRAESIKEGNHILLPRWSFDGTPHKGVVLIERAEHINSLPMRLRLHRMHLATRCPAVRDWRVRAEAGFVKEQ